MIKLTSLQKEELKKKIKEINVLAIRYNFPFFFSALVEDNGEKSKYYTETNLISAKGGTLDDKMREYLLVTAGYKVNRDKILNNEELEEIFNENDKKIVEVNTDKKTGENTRNILE